MYIMDNWNYKVFIFSAEFECNNCKKRFPMFYRNKREDKPNGRPYWGGGQKHNFRAAKANLYRHLNSCKPK